MKGLLISGHRRGSFIDLYIRGEDGRKHKITVTDFNPYFYIHTEYGEYTGIFGESLSKIYTKDPSDVRKERYKYNETWEADIPYVRRFLIDQGIYKGLEFPERKEASKNELRACEVNIDPVILYFDIEVIPGERFPDAKKAEYPVVAVSFKFSNNRYYFTYIFKEGEKKRIHKGANWVVVYCDSEKRLLNTFFDLITKQKQPDILTGWNISEFDIPYLKNRFKNLDLRWIDEGSFEVFDMLFGDRKIYRRRRHNLKEVVKEEKIAEEDVPSFKGVIDYYHENLKKFIEYSKDDVRYIVELEKRLGLIKYFYEFKYLSGVEDVESTFMTSVTIDTLLLRIAKENDIVLPTRTKKSEGRKTFEGGHVYAGEKGLYNDLAWFDFAGYYPSIINSFCLSPENITKKEEEDIIHIEDTGLSILKREGILQKLLKILLKKKVEVTKARDRSEPGSREYEILNRRREAVKGQINSSYGVLSYSNFRLFNPKIGESITHIGRDGLRYIMDVGEKQGYKVLLADTDSIMLQMPFEKAEDFGSFLTKKLREYFKAKYNVGVKINLEFEKYLKVLLLTGVKKRYAYRCCFDGKKCDYSSAKGFENIRTDQSTFTRKLLDELFNYIFYRKSKKEIEEFIERKMKEFREKPIQEIAITKQIGNPINSYKANTPHVRGVIYANKHFGTNFTHGSKPLMLWVKGVSGYPPTNVVCFEEDTELPKLIIDWERMEKVSITQKIKPILDAVGVDVYGNMRRQAKL